MTAEIRINGQSLISGLPEESGLYDTPIGKIGIDLRIDREKQVQEVILDCTHCEALQGKRGKSQRVIELGRKGIGSQQISPTETLEYDLGHRIKPRIMYVPRYYEWHSLAGNSAGEHHGEGVAWVPLKEVWDR